VSGSAAGAATLMAAPQTRHWTQRWPEASEWVRAGRGGQ
jgi:hypothetical protein